MSRENPSSGAADSPAPLPGPLSAANPRPRLLKLIHLNSG